MTRVNSAQTEIASLKSFSANIFRVPFSGRMEAISISKWSYMLFEYFYKQKISSVSEFKKKNQTYNSIISSLILLFKSDGMRYRMQFNFDMIHTLLVCYFHMIYVTKHTTIWHQFNKSCSILNDFGIVQYFWRSV